MATSSKAPRTRHVAMVVGESSNSHHHNNNVETNDSKHDFTLDCTRSHQPRDDGGMTTSRRALAPEAAVVAVNRAKDDDDKRKDDAVAAPRVRDRDRDRDHRRSSRVDNPAESSPRRHERSTDHKKEHSQRPLHLSSKRRGEDSRDRARERGRELELDHRRDREPDRLSHQHSRRRDDSRQKESSRSHTERQHRAASRSPSSRKRRGSQSPDRGDSASKKSRRSGSPRQADGFLPGRPHTSETQPGRSRRDSSARRARSPDRRNRGSKSRVSGKQGRSTSASHSRRARSRSRSRPRPSSKRRDSHSHYSERPHPGRRSLSPLSTTHPKSISRCASPISQSSRLPTAPDIRSRTHPTPNFEQHRSSRPGHGSPRDPKSAGGSKRRKSQDTPNSSSKFEPSSGANSIEVNMAARGNFRGGFHPYSHNSGHGTPNSSYHSSPTGPAHSPYGNSGRGWGNQQAFSPQQQYPPQYPQGGYSGPNGSQGPYQNHSPPYPPTGPAAQYPQGPSYRGGHRGGAGGFRGGQFGPPRGGYRGAFKNPQWTAGPGGGRGQHGPTVAEETDPSQSNPDLAEKAPPGDDANVTDNDNPFRPSKDLQVEDTGKAESTAEEQMPPPNRIPPTGPQSSQSSSKFSFAFKASKPAVSAPKPEISSKFNAPPPRREQSQQSNDRDRGGLPRNVPTEPASARPRGVDHRQQQQQQQQQQQRAEPPPPRVRIVKKTMKRLKKKTPLDPELAASDSVYFRKPGDKSVIGSGTYGKVFKGLNVYTKKLVALKKIKMEGERDGFPVTAVREIKLLQSLKHPNIVNLQEVMVEKNDCFMVFEYLSHDLTGLLNHPSYKLDPSQKKHLAMQMFEALDYLHKRGVLHRDIKAANILVSSEGILKLADFGLARFYAKRHQLDYTNRVITIWYRSPELLLGETQYGPAVDIWSAACVMVEIFTRHAIFPGDGGEINQLEKIYAILGTPTKQEWPNLVEMPWFELLRPGYRKQNVFAEKYKDRLTPAAFDLLSALFRYDPAKRPTAAEVLEHAYFKSEQPAPKQAIELQTLDGDWHELESKALRRENERKEKEAKRAAAKEASGAGAPTQAREAKERKRPNETNIESQRDAKRPHVDAGASQQPGPEAGAAAAG